MAGRASGWAGTPQTDTPHAPALLPLMLALARCAGAGRASLLAWGAALPLLLALLPRRLLSALLLVLPPALLALGWAAAALLPPLLLGLKSGHALLAAREGVVARPAAAWAGGAGVLEDVVAAEESFGLEAGLQLPDELELGLAAPADACQGGTGGVDAAAGGAAVAACAGGVGVQ